MSFKTQPVFIHESNGWDDTIMTHPVFKFMRVWEQALKDKTMFDAPFGTWHTPDFVYTDEQGKSSSGADGFKNQFEMHNALLVDFAHEPHMVWVSETADGYNAWGQAYMYCNLKVPGEKKETDATGKLWEYKVRAFVYGFAHLDAIHMSL
jgi:hypothetical protein